MLLLRTDRLPEGATWQYESASNRCKLLKVQGNVIGRSPTSAHLSAASSRLLDGVRNRRWNACARSSQAGRRYGLSLRIGTIFAYDFSAGARRRQAFWTFTFDSGPD